MPASPSASSRLESSQDALMRLVLDARAVAVEAFDDHSVEALHRTLVPTARELLDEGIRLLSGLHEPSSPANQELSSLCFVVRGECRDCRQALDRATGAGQADTLRILVQVERSRHTLTRGLTAVERKLAETTSTQSKTERLDFVRDSRAVRRATTLLRRSLAQSHDGGRPLSERIHAAHDSVDHLLRSPDFRLLRIYDRHIVRDLHARLDAWLGDPERTPQDGVSVLNEALNLGELLRAVNDRLELIDHDLALLEETLDCLAELPPRAPTPKGVCTRLGDLFGRDDVLDEILEGSDPSPRVLSSRLAYVHRQVSRRMGGPQKPV